jgi:hypothetical protein
MLSAIEAGAIQPVRQVPFIKGEGTDRNPIGPAVTSSQNPFLAQMKNAFARIERS